MNRNRAVRTESIIVGIDVGTTKITAVIASIDKDFPEILGFAKSPFEASAASVPWGGNHITDLIKFRLGVNVTKAERAKLAFSRGILNDEQSTAIRKLLDRELLVLCSHLDTELSKSGLEDELASGIALTGGTCKLPGLADALERVLQMPVRHAEFPTNQWLSNISADYASAVGLILRRISLFGAPT